MVKVTFGFGNSQQVSSSEYRSIGAIMASLTLQSMLGFDPGNTEAYVNDSRASSSQSLHDGDEVELIRKAGGKSAEALMTHENQLVPLSISSQLLSLLKQHGENALAVLRDALDKAGIKAEILANKNKRALIKSLPSYQELEANFINMLLSRRPFDLKMIVLTDEMKASLDASHAEAFEGVKALQKEFHETQEKAEAWYKAVLTDLSLCVTVFDQRRIIEKALKSDPTKPWDFTASI